MAKILQVKWEALLLGLLLVSSPVPTEAISANTDNGNAVSNHSFEDQLDRWLKYTQHATADSTIIADSSKAVAGSYSARIDMGNAPQIGFIGLYQILPFPHGNLRFSNFTIDSDNFDFWFYIEPKYDGAADLVLRFISVSGLEMDYAFDPDPRLSYPNQTFADGRVSVKSFMFSGYAHGQWHYFSRNIRTDWEAPTRMPNGELKPGNSANEALYWIEFDAIQFRDYTGKSYSEMVWVDEVRLYYGNALPPPALPPSLGNNTNNYLIVIGAIAALLMGLVVVLARRRGKERTEDFTSPGVQGVAAHYFGKSAFQTKTALQLIPGLSGTD